MNQLIHPDCHPFTAAGNLKQISAFYEEGRRVMWMMLRAQPRPCFNHELIDEIMTLARAAKDSGLPIDFWVTGSLVPQIYNVGGDLNFFAEAIRTGKREALRAYARACVDCVHAATRGFDTGAISLAMIEGTALGGGFEAALAHHFVLAQNSARMGFPEMAFNLFPGMGGYSLVARRSGMKLAEELIARASPIPPNGSTPGAWWTCCSSRATPTRPRARSSTRCGPSLTACAPCCARASAC